MPPKKLVRKPSAPQPWVMSVAVMVNDRERSKRWYLEKLHLALLTDEDHWVTVGRKGRGGALHLCQVSEAGEGAALEPGNTGILLQLGGDFAANCADLQKGGVEFRVPPTKADWGTYATIVDPDGNELVLMPS